MALPLRSHPSFGKSSSSSYPLSPQKKTTPSLLILASALLVFSSTFFVRSPKSTNNSPDISPQVSEQVIPEHTQDKAPIPDDLLSSLPARFEPNRGQADPNYLYFAKTKSFQAAIAKDRIVFALEEPSAEEQTPSQAEERSPGHIKDHNPASPPRQSKTRYVFMYFEGANPAAEIHTERPQPGISNYLKGSDPSSWVTDVEGFSALRIKEIYPGIDLFLEDKKGEIAYSFFVSERADPDLIELRFETDLPLSLSDQGELLIGTDKAKLTHSSPFAYQGGKENPVEVSFALEENKASFALGDYDKDRPLVIDPTLSYSTYLGGSGRGESGEAVAVDSFGSAYVTGWSDSLNFPTISAFQGTYGGGGYDAFVTKLASSGSFLLYSTYLGGSGYDSGGGIAVDSSGAAYVVGKTESSDFPTASAYQNDQGGGDAFVTKLSPSGNTLSYSTYLGGGGDDSGQGIAVDSSGAAYVTGFTASDDFPTSFAYQNARVGSYDAFVTKLSPSGNTLSYSTYLGGGGEDYAEGIAVDSSGAAHVTGWTASLDFPTASPFQSANARGSDAFVTKLSPSGNTLSYSTYLGGERNDFGDGIAVDASGAAYVTGTTFSSSFVATLSAFQLGNAGSWDAFVTKLSASGALSYSSYLGGGGVDVGFAIAAGSSGIAYVTGWTESSDFPTASAYQNDQGGGDAFVTKVDTTKICRHFGCRDTLSYSTYLGGGDADVGYGIAVDSSGAAYVTGSTDSSNFPTASAFQQDLPGKDAFVTKLNPSGSSLAYSTYLGGMSEDHGFDIAVDSSGAAYVTGWTDSAAFPTVSPFQGDRGGFDVFVTKFDPSGSALVYSTYLGGSANDYGEGIAVDSSGAVYVTGETMSSDLQITLNAYQPVNAGGVDAFITKLAPSGSSLIYSSYLGGGSDDRGYAIAADSSGRAYITGSTDSSDFPTASPVRTDQPGTDAFVAKVDTTSTCWVRCSSLLYSTYLGGGGADIGWDIAVDSSGAAYVTGETMSSDFPLAPGAYQAGNGGGTDAFFTKLSSSGDALLYSSYLGGAAADYGYGIAVDSSGAVYLTGTTYSDNFPIASPYLSDRGGADAFLTKFSPSGSSLSLSASTYLGGGSADTGNGIAVDFAGTVLVTGSTLSSDFPTVSPYQQDQGGTDAFVARFDPSVTSLLYASYLGGGGIDRGWGVAADSAGVAYVAGDTSSSDFPVAHPYQGYQGGFDAFVTKLEARSSLLSDVVVREDDGKILLFWDHPSAGAAEFVRIVRKSGPTPPANPDDGTVVYDGPGKSYIDYGLSNGEPYSYGFFPHDASQVYSQPVFAASRVPGAHPGLPYAFFVSEGYTGNEAFAAVQYLTLGNLEGADSYVVLTFYQQDSPAVEFSTVVPGRSRRTVVADSILGEGKAAGVSVAVKSGPGVLLERPMYFAGDPGTGSAVADGHNAVGVPHPRSDWYFAEGYTGAGFVEYLSLVNPSGTSHAETELQFVFNGALPPSTTLVRVPPQSRVTVNINSVVGSDKEVSVRALVTSGPGIVAERSLYFAADPALGAVVTGGHAKPGAASLGRSFYFAEGYTGLGFVEYLTFQNPSDSPSRADVEYNFNSGTPPVTKSYTIPANSRFTVLVNEEVGKKKEVSAKITVPDGKPALAVERPMYFSSDLPLGALVSAGHVGPGAPTPSSSWSFSEGYTGAGYAEYLTVQNPSAAETANVRIEYVFNDGGAPIVIERSIPPSTRATYNVKSDVGEGREVSVLLTVLSGPGVVAERPMYFVADPALGSQVRGGTVALGYAP